MKIGVFCSANNNIDPDFFTATEEMGRWMADNGHTLVFGGCNIGLMPVSYTHLTLPTNSLV